MIRSAGCWLVALAAIGLVPLAGAQPSPSPSPATPAPLQGFVSFREALAQRIIDADLKARSWGEIDEIALTLDGLHIEKLEVGADREVSIAGFNRKTPGERKQVEGITDFLEALQKSPLENVRLKTITWVPHGDETVASFTITARVARD